MPRTTRSTRKVVAPLDELSDGGVNETKAGVTRQTRNTRKKAGGAVLDQPPKEEVKETLQPLEEDDEKQEPREEVKETAPARSTRGRKKMAEEPVPEPVQEEKQELEEAQDQKPATRKSTRARPKAKPKLQTLDEDQEAEPVVEKPARKGRSKRQQSAIEEQAPVEKEPVVEESEGPTIQVSKEPIDVAEEFQVIGADDSDFESEATMQAEDAGPDSPSQQLFSCNTTSLNSNQPTEEDEPKPDQEVEVEPQTKHGHELEAGNRRETQDSFVTAIDDNDGDGMTPEKAILEDRRSFVHAPASKENPSQDKISGLAAWVQNTPVKARTEPATVAPKTVSKTPRVAKTPKTVAKTPKFNPDIHDVSDVEDCGNDSFADMVVSKRSLAIATVAEEDIEQILEPMQGKHVEKVTETTEEENIPEGALVQSVEKPLVEENNTDTSKPIPNEARKLSALSAKPVMAKKPVKFEKTLKLKRPGTTTAAPPVKEKVPKPPTAPTANTTAVRSKRTAAAPSAPSMPKRTARAPTTANTSTKLAPAPSRTISNSTAASSTAPTGTTRTLSTTSTTGGPRAPIPRPTSLSTPAPPAKSTKPPTVPKFELPGEAVQRKLLAAKAERQARMEEAATRRATEAAEKKRRAEEEDRRRRETFKARPVPKSIYKQPLPTAAAAAAPKVENAKAGGKREAEAEMEGSKRKGEAVGMGIDAKNKVTSPPRLLKPAPGAPTVAVSTHHAKKAPHLPKSEVEERVDREAAIRGARRQFAERGKETARLWAEAQRMKAERKAAAAAAAAAATAGPGVTVSAAAVGEEEVKA